MKAGSDEAAVRWASFRPIYSAPVPLVEIRPACPSRRRQSWLLLATRSAPARNDLAVLAIPRYSAITSSSGSPAEPDGGLAPSRAASVGATSIVCTRRKMRCDLRPFPAKMIGTKVS